MKLNSPKTPKTHKNVSQKSYLKPKDRTKSSNIYGAVRATAPTSNINFSSIVEANVEAEDAAKQHIKDEKPVKEKRKTYQLDKDKKVILPTPPDEPIHPKNCPRIFCSENRKNSDLFMRAITIAMLHLLLIPMSLSIFTYFIVNSDADVLKVLSTYGERRERIDMAFGVILFVVNAIGLVLALCLGLMKEQSGKNPRCYYVARSYFFLQCATLALQFVQFILCVISYGRSSRLKANSAVFLNLYWESSSFRYSFDGYQIRYQCCGIHSYRNWLKSPFWANISEYYENDVIGVPRSCCKPEVKGCVHIGEDSALTINKDNCYNVMRDTIVESYAFLWMVLLGVMVVQALAMFLCHVAMRSFITVFKQASLEMIKFMILKRFEIFFNIFF
ncbi:hypothetical protein HELRODRAFT_182058 [Helobdella robusta]|uniref:Tetraspanin n=1 Tax=Helobdella robusta TaxID=6412 RepID=T1FHP0_HELRO|nr:hypothetical protein HELRODRAFT_182058 [Helobdella robusta]ESN91879.1 hypothetical protein HELRODRAFT_182058 [Helobdella robusta]